MADLTSQKDEITFGVDEFIRGTPEKKILNTQLAVVPVGKDKPAKRYVLGFWAGFHAVALIYEGPFETMQPALKIIKAQLATHGYRLTPHSSGSPNRFTVWKGGDAPF